MEGLRVIEDSCLPIKTKGIILLGKFRFGLYQEEDSLVYLNSIKALFKLVEKYPDEICDWLNLIYESLKDQSGDREKAASKLENDNGNDVIEWDKRLINKKLRVGKAMVLIIQRAGKV
ncbi:hypothetical protein PPACK8108_LOCUS26301 [Phakopsora pachyrhizi]|uniref:RNA polymerase II assembly factor Rtp1 C-terminal domain-containing protein n=1 Tax=Phakopsora pachyrhizi TaxID=170000 RepID=A0AAV0BX23_PHAPC|nr:hypothetical protein PPACK8108_LOCUS26301 [Phakopsora pachyrhizi]